MDKRTVIDSQEINSKLNTLAEKIYSDIENIDNFAIVGLQTRGVELANRIKTSIESLSGKTVQSGVLDITFHRDDIATRGVLPAIKETRIEFDITNMTILLVDDVIFTGRTTKAALEAVMTFGRPKAIKLLVLVDRGNRELPIQPDYLGCKVETKIKDLIKVRLQETDGIDDAVIFETE